MPPISADCGALQSPLTLFKCLADDTRARLMLLIQAAGELCVCDLMQALDESQPKISRHLAQLRRCGLLLDRRAGQWVYYQIHPDLPTWARAVLQAAAHGAQAQVQADHGRFTDITTSHLKATG